MYDLNRNPINYTPVDTHLDRRVFYYIINYVNAIIWSITNPCGL